MTPASFLIRLIIFWIVCLFVFFTRDGFKIKPYLIILLAFIITLIKPLKFWRYLIAFIIIFFDWLFYPFKPKKGMSLFLGPPRSGKTTMAAYLSSWYPGYNFERHRKTFFQKLSGLMRGANPASRVAQGTEFTTSPEQLAVTDQKASPSEQSSSTTFPLDVYSNVPIKNTYKIERSDIGKVDISNGMLIVDEAGIDFSGRLAMQDKNSRIERDTYEWIKLYGHYHIEYFCCFSQRLDIDPVVRELADQLYFIRKLGRIPFVICFVGTKAGFDIDKTEGRKYGEVVHGYKYAPFDVHLVFNPPLWHLFDSWDAPALPKKEFIIWGDESRYS